MPPASGAPSLNHWTARKAPKRFFKEGTQTSHKHVETLVTSFIIRERQTAVRGTPRMAAIRSQAIVLKILQGDWDPRALLVGTVSWGRCFGKLLGDSLKC